MSWKKFINLLDNEDSESNFVIGIDIGTETSSIAFYDIKRKEAELIDLSGGYGKASIPTVVQYIPETKEWVFGEYALLNTETEKTITINSFIKLLGKMEYIEIDNRVINIANIFSLFIKDLINNVKNINPKATITGIICSIPNYLNQEAMEELKLAFSNAGFSNNLIALVHDIECIFANHYYNKILTKEKVLLLDFGSSSLRGGVYDIDKQASDINITTISSYFDKELGSNYIDNQILKLFMSYYEINTNVSFESFSDELKRELDIFVYQHKSMLLNASIDDKPIRLYFNFSFPPFQVNITKDDMYKILQPLILSFKYYINILLERNPYNGKKISVSDINKVICVGGGFEMFWVKQLIKEMFKGTDIVFDKNTKGTLAQGAAVISASKLKALEDINFNIIDKQKLNYDIGILVKEGDKDKFIPIVEKNSFWWQYSEPKYVLVNNRDTDDITINIYIRDELGEVKFVTSVTLDELKVSNNKIVKISISIEYSNFQEIVATFIDCGFGEIFKSSGFSKAVMLKI